LGVSGIPSEAEIAIPASVAARIAGISERRLKAWDHSKLIQPAVRRQLSDRNTVRLYGFQELVELRVLRALHERQMAPQHIAKVIKRLRAQGYDAPLRQLVYAVSAGELFFKHPNGEWEGGRRPDQVVLHEVLDLELIRSQVRRALARPRPPGSVGRVERRRKVLGSKPVLAGTRTPVSAVSSYVKRGYSDKEILAALPHLTPADIEAVRAQIS
jgi:uncharacterized protein (DUF433 family)